MEGSEGDPLSWHLSGERPAPMAVEWENSLRATSLLGTPFLQYRQGGEEPPTLRLLPTDRSSAGGDPDWPTAPLRVSPLPPQWSEGEWAAPGVGM